MPIRPTFLGTLHYSPSFMEFFPHLKRGCSTRDRFTTGYAKLPKNLEIWCAERRIDYARLCENF